MACKPDDDDLMLKGKEEVKEEVKGKEEVKVEIDEEIEEEEVKEKEKGGRGKKKNKKKDKKKGQKKVVLEEDDEPVDVSKETFHLFYGTASPFSQWHPAEFEVDGINFNCCEQFMMYQKAILFKDDEMAEKILKSTEPREQKALGRRVRNFDDTTWKEKCRDIVKRGNMAKFSQNPSLKKHLLATVGKTLVEASPRDRIWGIGLGQSNPKAHNRKLWRGRNWLGQALTEVRDELIDSIPAVKVSK